MNSLVRYSNSNDDEVGRLRDALNKAKSDLAEVLDECMFSEQQRNKAEDALKAAGSQFTVDKEVLSCIDVMLLYINAMEHQVLLPAATTISALVAQTLSDARADAQKRLEVVSSLVSAEAPYSLRRALSLSDPPASVSAQAVVRRHEILAGAAPLQLEDCYVTIFSMMSTSQNLRSLAFELTSKLKAHDRMGQEDSAADANALSTQKRSRELLEEVVAMRPDGQAQLRLLERVRELEGIVEAHEAERREVAQRFQVLQRAIDSAKATDQQRESDTVQAEELALFRMQRQHQAETIQAQQEELLALGRELREAKRDHEEQIARVKKQLNDTIAFQSANDVDEFIKKVDQQPGNDGRNQRSNGLSRAETQSYQTKLRAFELTVTALNTELANMEDKLVALERKSDDEAAENARLVAELKRRHKGELDECHDIVGKLTLELDNLMKENTSLKQRIKKHLK